MDERTFLHADGACLDNETMEILNKDINSN